MKINSAVFHVPDFKNGRNEWVRSYKRTIGNVSTQYYTNAGCRWRSMYDRCKVGGNTQSRSSTYIGCSLDFIDFNCFAEWCQSQTGYLERDQQGRVWHLDKDLLVKGNKSYSKDHVVFIPSIINAHFRTTESVRGKYPLGVHNQNRISNPYAANCSIDGKQTFLGVFKTALAAHQAWQKAKSEEFFKFALDTSLDERVRSSLSDRAEQIRLDLKAGIETVGY